MPSEGRPSLAISMPGVITGITDPLLGTETGEDVNDKGVGIGLTDPPALGTGDVELGPFLRVKEFPLIILNRSRGFLDFLEDVDWPELERSVLYIGLVFGRRSWEKCSNSGVNIN